MAAFWGGGSCVKIKEYGARWIGERERKAVGGNKAEGGSTCSVVGGGRARRNSGEIGGEDNIRRGRVMGAIGF